MTDQFYQDVEERSEKLCVEEKPIQIACFCHKADHRDWKRLEQHLEAVQLQAQHLGCPMCWTMFECNPKDSTHRSQMEKATQAITAADILLLGLSVDMQLLLLQEEDFNTALLSKLNLVMQKTTLWGQAPYIAGIRMKQILWSGGEPRGIQFMPCYQPQTLADPHHKDARCVEIARQVYKWIKDIHEAFIYNVTKK